MPASSGFAPPGVARPWCPGGSITRHYAKRGPAAQKSFRILRALARGTFMEVGFHFSISKFCVEKPDAVGNPKACRDFDPRCAPPGS
jgi:hypothetical protein